MNAYIYYLLLYLPLGGTNVNYYCNDVSLYVKRNLQKLFFAQDHSKSHVLTCQVPVDTSWSNFT